MEWLQKIYLLVLTPFCRLSEKIDRRVKLAAIVAICTILYLLEYIWYTLVGFGIVPTLLWRMYQAIFLIALLVFFGLDMPLTRVKWNKLFAYLWFALGMLIFIIGFFTRQNPGYWMSGPVIAIGFPCLYTIYGKDGKYLKLFNSFCKAAIVIALLYFFVSLLGEFYSSNIWDPSGRYNGIAEDSNRLGELCIVSFCFGLYGIFVCKQKVFRILIPITLGILCGQVYLSQSRTTILAFFLIGLFYLGISVKDVFSKKSYRSIVRGAGIVLIAIVIALGTVLVTNGAHTARLTMDRTESTADADPGVEQTPHRNILPEAEEDINMYSSGRITIWKTYIENFNLFGNERDLETPISGDFYQVNAHNSLIEITYRSGMITGVIYLLVEILVGVYILKVLLRNNRKNTYGDYLFATMSIGYLIFTNLMPAYNPITSIIFFAFCFTLFPIILERSK